jgi:hypothetical protein
MVLLMLLKLASCPLYLDSNEIDSHAARRCGMVLLMLLKLASCQGERCAHSENETLPVIISLDMLKQSPRIPGGTEITAVEMGTSIIPVKTLQLRKIGLSIDS